MPHVQSGTARRVACWHDGPVNHYQIVVLVGSLRKDSLNRQLASTIQANVLGQEPDDLDEAEIERSIREINEAIKRSSQKKP